MPSRMTVHKWFLRMQYELSLRLVSGGEGLDKELTTPQVSRPGLTLAGYFRHFDARQMQVLGQQEIAYVSDLAPARRSEIFRQMLDADMPCVVVTRGLDPPAELVEESRRAATALLSTKMSTGSFIARTIVYLEEEFGPSEVLHANLAEVYGVGVLINQIAAAVSFRRYRTRTTGRSSAHDGRPALTFRPLLFAVPEATGQPPRVHVGLSISGW